MPLAARAGSHAGVVDDAGRGGWQDRVGGRGDAPPQEVGGVGTGGRGWDEGSYFVDRGHSSKTQSHRVHVSPCISTQGYMLHCSFEKTVVERWL